MFESKKIICKSEEYNDIVLKELEKSIKPNSRILLVCKDTEKFGTMINTVCENNEYIKNSMEHLYNGIQNKAIFKFKDGKQQCVIECCAIKKVNMILGLKVNELFIIDINSEDKEFKSDYKNRLYPRLMPYSPDYKDMTIKNIYID